jgi:hypothetical protein
MSCQKGPPKNRLCNPERPRPALPNSWGVLCPLRRKGGGTGGPRPVITRELSCLERSTGCVRSGCCSRDRGQIGSRRSQAAGVSNTLFVFKRASGVRM